MSSFELLSQQFKRIAEPKLWNHISGIFLIGISIEGESEIYWCSLLSNPEEPHGVGIYRGATGLDSFRLITQHQSEEYEPELLANLDAIFITLEKEENLSAAHQNLIDSNECSKYEADAYIIPSSKRIGVPQQIAQEKELILASKVIHKFADFLQPLSDTGLTLHGTEYIVLPETDALFAQWQSYRVNPDEYGVDHKANLDLPIVPGYKSGLENIEIQGTIWEIHECYSPIVITDGPSGAYYPRMLLVINKNEGKILAHEIYEHGQYSQNVFLAKIIEGFEFSKYIPCEIEVKSKSAHLLLDDLLSEFGVDVNLVKTLPNAEDCLRSMAAHFMRQDANEN